MSDVFTSTRNIVWELLTKAPKHETGKFGGTNYRKVMLDSAVEIDRLVILNMSQDKVINDLLAVLDIKPDEKQKIRDDLMAIYEDKSLVIEDVYKFYNGGNT